MWQNRTRIVAQKPFHISKALHVDVRGVFIYFINVIVTTVTRTCHLVKLLVWTTRMPGVVLLKVPSNGVTVTELTYYDYIFLSFGC